MHFAYPSRKNSTPPHFVPRSTQWPNLRRRRLKVIALAGLLFVAFVYFVVRPGRGHAALKEYVPSGNPPTVLVTVLDESHYSKPYLDEIRENRIQYAARHGMQSRQFCVAAIAMADLYYRVPDLFPQDRRLRPQGRAVHLD